MFWNITAIMTIVVAFLGMTASTLCLYDDATGKPYTRTDLFLEVMALLGCICALLLAGHQLWPTWLT